MSALRRKLRTSSFSILRKTYGIRTNTFDEEITVSTNGAIVRFCTEERADHKNYCATPVMPNRRHIRNLANSSEKVKK